MSRPAHVVSALLTAALLQACGSPAPDAPSPAGATPRPATQLPAAPPVSGAARARPLPCPTAGGPALAGSFLLPAGGDGPYPTAVFFPGAQMWNRDGNLPDTPWGHYRDLADAVTAAGGAAYLYDKPGTGETGGPPPNVRDRAVESAALDCARAQPESDDARIVAVAHSQGTVVVVSAILETTLGRPDTAPISALVLLSPVVDPEALAALPPTLPVTLVRGELDGGGEEDLARMRALGERGRHVLVPGGDHLLFDATNGDPDPTLPGTTISPVAAEAVAAAVVGKR